MKHFRLQAVVLVRLIQVGIARANGEQASSSSAASLALAA
jgi:hypothetical protein